MELKRFFDIVDYNQKNEQKTTKAVKKFCEEMDIRDYERKIFDNIFLKELACQKYIFSFYIPMKNKEVGACCYHNEKMKYILVNSSIPKANMNFAFSHELYHAFISEKNETTIDVFLDHQYENEDEERDANAFAGAFLLPKEQTKKLWIKLDKEETFQKILRISSFFGTPYIATLLRLTELGCLENDVEQIENLLRKEKTQIRDEYERLSLECSLLEPTWVDNYKGILYMTDKSIERLIESECINERDAVFYKENLERLYLSIREENHA